MLAVTFITRSAITAGVVDLCAKLPLDAASETGSPINDHDSVRPVIDAIVSRYHTGRRRAWLPWPVKLIVVWCV
ncbi:hypothetical protein [Burkholderia sp. JP2-270]|uniref:hypothetical protein n=1 Tax=Burkholderia sp. JP2-270 TaxID=2217913 RepID=UPI0013A6CF90|nr:hypothetical protein [Burkholderia sp. JP2-270]